MSSLHSNAALSTLARQLGLPVVPVGTSLVVSLSFSSLRRLKTRMLVGHPCVLLRNADNENGATGGVTAPAPPPPRRPPAYNPLIAARRAPAAAPAARPPPPPSSQPPAQAAQRPVQRQAPLQPAAVQVLHCAVSSLLPALTFSSGSSVWNCFFLNVDLPYRRFHSRNFPNPSVHRCSRNKEVQSFCHLDSVRMSIATAMRCLVRSNRRPRRRLRWCLGASMTHCRTTRMTTTTPTPSSVPSCTCGLYPMIKSRTTAQPFENRHSCARSLGSATLATRRGIPCEVTCKSLSRCTP